MIINKQDKTFQTQSHRPAENWLGDDWFMVPDGTELAEKILANYPNFDLVLDGEGELIDITPTDPPPSPSLPIDPMAELTQRIEALEAALAAR